MSLPKEKLIEEGQGSSSSATQLNHSTGEELVAGEAPRVPESGAQRGWVSPRIESLGRVADMTLSGMGFGTMGMG